MLLKRHTVCNYVLYCTRLEEVVNTTEGKKTTEKEKRRKRDGIIIQFDRGTAVSFCAMYLEWFSTPGSGR